MTLEMVLNYILHALVCDTKLLGCVANVYGPKCTMLRIVLLLFNIGLSVFDCYSDWKVWIAIKDMTTHCLNFQQPGATVGWHSQCWVASLCFYVFLMRYLGSLLLAPLLQH